MEHHQQTPTASSTSTTTTVGGSAGTTTSTITQQPKKLNIVRPHQQAATTTTATATPSSTKTATTDTPTSTTTTTTFSITSAPFIPSSSSSSSSRKIAQEKRPKQYPKKNKSKKQQQQKEKLPKSTTSPPTTAISTINTKGIVATNVDNDDDDDDITTTSNGEQQTELSKDISKQLNAKKNDPNAYLCPICMDVVKRVDDIWECHKCWNIFHANCIIHWAESQRKVSQVPQQQPQSLLQSPLQYQQQLSSSSPTTSTRTNSIFDYIQVQMERQNIRIPERGYDYTDSSSSSSSSSSMKETALKPWTCPCCRSGYTETPIASCFCGKLKGTKIIPLYNEPHSCGEMCGRLREGTTCPHRCTLACHPGPCPPCPMLGAAKRCHCGKTEVVLRCGEGAGGVSCGQPCGKLLNCGKHHCTEICHPGPCKPCAVQTEVTCHCGKHTEQRLCGDCDNSGSFSCGKICGKLLDCGNHHCSDLCHTGPCRPCSLQPGVLRTCPCGKALIADICPQRKSCLEPVPTCGKVCGKRLPFCSHTCQELCHTGPCPPCSVSVTVPCRCGSTRQTVPCSQAQRPDGVLCNNVCTAKLSCKRHRCGVRCCQSMNDPEDTAGVHVCMRICGRPLTCGHHTCELLCHSGRCPPCTHMTYDAVACRCGRTVAQPPIPCGAVLPACPYPCTVERPCGHRDNHNCHFGECPPCTTLVDRMCVGGHRIVRNIPCHMKEISCGQVCGKLLQCGEHTCRENCHPEPCPDWQPPKDALWYSEKRKKNKKKKSKAQKKKKNSEAVTTGNSASEGGSNEDGGAQPATARLSCGQVCGRVKKCGHLCKHMCHPGTACPEDPCMEMVQIHCGCGVRTTMAHCFCALDAAEKLECDDTCREVARRRMLADAFGIRPADGTVPAYSSFLIYYARAHRDYVAELEQTFAKFIADPEAKLLPLDPRLDPIARKFALALAKYYGFSVFTDRDQTHSLTKLSIAGSPAVPLSVVAASEESSAIAAATNLKNTRRAADSSTCIDQEDHSFTLHITCNSSSSDSPDDHLDKKAIMDAVRPYNAVGCYFVSLGSREALVTARDENTLNAVRAKLAPLPITVT